ncbi:17.3 kDa class I heat shock protein [Tanacetum coccineum]
MEVKPLDHTKLEDLDLNACNHDVPLSSREVPTFDEPKPQPQPLPNCSSLDVSLGVERGPEPPIKPHSPDSFRIKVLDHLTIHTMSSRHVASFYPKDVYCYYRPCIDDPKKHYGFKPDFPISSPSGLSNETSALVNTRVDWKETPEAHVFKADLPGIKKEEVKVEVEDGRVLQITGERNVEKEDKNDKWHRVERSSGKFTRRFMLPENAKIYQIKAGMENGVLTITVPKEEVKKPDVKSIQISG